MRPACQLASQQLKLPADVPVRWRAQHILEALNLVGQEVPFEREIEELRRRLAHVDHEFKHVKDVSRNGTCYFYAENLRLQEAGLRPKTASGRTLIAAGNHEKALTVVWLETNMERDMGDGMKLWQKMALEMGSNADDRDAAERCL